MSEGKNPYLYSYISLKNKEKFSFLEVPQCYVNCNGLEILFESEHLILWHKIALEYILSSKESVIENEKLCDETWDILSKIPPMTN